MIQYDTTVDWDSTLIDLEYTDIDNPLVKGLVCFAIKITTGAPTATANKFSKACQIQNAYDGTWYENTGSTASPVWSLVPSTGSGITTLTGDVTAGPGVGSQAAVVNKASANFSVGGVYQNSISYLSGPGALDVTKGQNEIQATGVGDALTLADGLDGQVMDILMTGLSMGGTSVLTPSDTCGYSTITFSALGQSARLVYSGDFGGWVVSSVHGAVVA